MKNVFEKKNDIEEMSIFGPSFLIILSLLLLISSKDKCPLTQEKIKYGKTKLVFTDILLEYLNFCFIILVYACVRNALNLLMAKFVKHC